MTVCPISGRRFEPRYPGEVAIPAGHAGQTQAAVILCYQVRTISIARIKSIEILAGLGVQYVTDRGIRLRVREALTHHFGLDFPARADGAG